MQAYTIIRENGRSFHSGFQNREAAIKLAEVMGDAVRIEDWQGQTVWSRSAGRGGGLPPFVFVVILWFVIAAAMWGLVHVIP